MRATLMGTQPISPGAVVARIWEIYRGQFPMLAGTAVCALQFLIPLVLSGGSAIFLSVSVALRRA